MWSSYIHLSIQFVTFPCMRNYFLFKPCIVVVILIVVNKCLFRSMPAQITGTVTFVKGIRAVLDIALNVDDPMAQANTDTLAVPHNTNDPDMDEIAKLVLYSGRLHPERAPLTRSNLRMVVSNIHTPLKRKGQYNGWLREHTEMVIEAMSKPMQSRKRRQPLGMLKDEDEDARPPVASRSSNVAQSVCSPGDEDEDARPHVASRSSNGAQSVCSPGESSSDSSSSSNGQEESHHVVPAVKPTVMQETPKNSMEELLHYVGDVEDAMRSTETTLRKTVDELASVETERDDLLTIIEHTGRRAAMV
jgi:hypothetical protein